MRSPSTTQIVRFIPSYFPYVTGPGNQAREISRRMQSRGFASTIVTTDLGAKDAPRREVLDGVPIVRVPTLVGFMQYQIAPSALKALADLPADIIHAHNYRSFLTDMAAITARRRRIPLVLHLHGTISGFRRIVSSRGRWIYGAYDRITRPLGVLRADRFVVSTSEEAAEAIEYGLDPGRIVTIPMGIDADIYEFPDERREAGTITFAGRLSEDRNVDDLLAALGRIRQLEWKCLVVGGDERRSALNPTGYVDRLKARARELNIHDRVQFTGPIYGEELRRVYARSGIFAYTSKYENFGQTILEAAAAGCALATTPVGVANDLVRSQKTGFLVPHGDVVGLAERLEYLLTHPEEQRSMGRAARQAVIEGYGWSGIETQYQALYQSLLAPSSRGAQG